MTGIGRLAVTLEKATDKSSSSYVTTVAEQMFDSSGHAVPGQLRMATSAARKHMNISAELSEIPT